MNSAFADRGRRDVVMIDALPITDGEPLRLVFESRKSTWRQGVWLMTDQHLHVNDQDCPSVDLWEDSAPQEIQMICNTKNGKLLLYNIWDDGSGRESQSWSSGMLIEELPNGRRYRCNDFGFDTDFDKLVFCIVRMTDRA